MNTRRDKGKKIEKLLISKITDLIILSKQSTTMGLQKGPIAAVPSTAMISCFSAMKDFCAIELGILFLRLHWQPQGYLC